MGEKILASTAWPAARGLATDRGQSANRRQPAQLRREAFGVLVRKTQNNRIGRELKTLDGVLRNDAILVLDLDWHMLIGEQRLCLVEDPGHFSRLDSVLVVLAHPHLQLTGRALTELASTIDEGLVYESHFGDVKGNRHSRAIGQSQTEVPLRMLGQEGFEFGKVHGLIVVLLGFASFTGPGQQLPSRCARRASARFTSAARSPLPGKFFITAFNRGR